MLTTPRCDAVAAPSYFGFGLSVFILIGILLSYLLQHHRILSRRSSAGISPYFVLLGTTSATCALANIIALPASRADVACCKVVGRFACLAALMGVLQIGAVWVCFVVILLLFLLFFPRATTALPPPVLKPMTEADPPQPSYSTALAVTAICVLHAVATALASTLIQTRAPQQLQAYANALGLAAAALASIQYFPQLWTTWRLRTVGSLSIVMMCIQTPGSFLWSATLAARLGWSGWSTWGVYLLTGLLQGSLLAMGSLFEWRKWQARQQAATLPHDPLATHDSQPAETTPLLGHEE